MEAFLLGLVDLAHAAHGHAADEAIIAQPRGDARLDLGTGTIQIVLRLEQLAQSADRLDGRIDLEERELGLDAVGRAAQLSYVPESGDVAGLVDQGEAEGLQCRLRLSFGEKPAPEGLAPLGELRLGRTGIRRGGKKIEQPPIEAHGVGRGE